MKKLRLIFSLGVLLYGQSADAQKYSAETSLVTFFSDAAIEDIKAENTKAVSIFNVSTGEVAFSIPIKDFEFEKSLMKEHFNEKYLESEKFPKATFAGKFIGFKSDAGGEQAVTAQGKLTIHGVTREITVPGTIEIVGGKITAKSMFMVKLVDYKVKIPQLLWQNIAEQVEVSITISYKSL